MGVVLFTAASLACAISPNLPVLIAARAVQGMGAALLTPASLALLGAAFDAKGRGQAVGVWAGASGLTSAIGPVLGGWLTDVVSWRAVFLINLPVAALAVWLVSAGAKESRGSNSGPVDWPGAAAVTIGLGAIVWALTAAPATGATLPVLGGLALGAGALAAFVAIERKALNPMTPLALFKSMTFSGVNALTFLLYAAMGRGLLPPAIPVDPGARLRRRRRGERPSCRCPWDWACFPPSPDGSRPRSARGRCWSWARS